jgi:aryl-alcohol dehydrogenase-like predicted oxidoreductase
MKYKQVGTTGLKASELCLGTMIFGGQVDAAASIQIIQRALDLGVNFLDTANNYGDGRSEAIVGKALKGVREEVVVATKVEAVTGPGPNDYGLSRKNILRAVEASLTRLDTTYIDLYQVHHPDPSTPLTETLTALDDLVRMGKVRYIGCSNFPAWYLEKALRVSEVHDLAAFTTVQPRYNLLDRGIERELLPLCLDEGIGVLPYSPLAGGFLTGKYQPGQPAPAGSRGAGRPAWVDRRFTPRNHAVLTELARISGETGLPLSQLSLAWLLENPVVTAPIVGASSLAQLEVNVDVVNHPVPGEALQRISEVSKPDWLRDQEEEDAQFQRNRDAMRIRRWGHAGQTPQFT